MTGGERNVYVCAGERSVMEADCRKLLDLCNVASPGTPSGFPLFGKSSLLTCFWGLAVSWEVSEHRSPGQFGTDTWFLSVVASNY